MSQRQSGWAASAAGQTRPRVLYFSRIDFPSPKANSIQSFNTCLEMAREGADVLLVVRRLTASRRDCFTYYGEAEHPRLRFVSLSLPLVADFNDWRGPYFRVYLQTFLRRHTKGPTLLMTRDPAGLELLDLVRSMRPPADLRTVFEVHKLAFLTKATHQEERGRSLQDPVVQEKVERRRALEARTYAGIDGLICTSDNARRMLEEHFPVHAPLCVVPNGTRIPVDAAGHLQIAGTLDDAGRDLDLLYVGQLYRWKGIDGLLRALARLPDAHLTVVGGNTSEDLQRVEAVAAALGITDRLTLEGQVAPHRVAAYLARARVGVIPLPRDGFVEAEYFTSPLKAFEMMRAGVPIVATDLPSTREILRHDDNAWLVRPDDPEALAAGLATLRANRDHAARLVMNAAESVAEYSWKARARRVLEFATGLEPARETSRT